MEKRSLMKEYTLLRLIEYLYLSCVMSIMLSDREITILPAHLSRKIFRCH